MDVSFTQAVRRFLEKLAGSQSAQREIAELVELSARSGGSLRGWRFDREDIHERHGFPDARVLALRPPKLEP